MWFKRLVQHLFNPLHVFCRLRQCGLGAVGARRVCSLYERCVYRFVMPSRHSV